MVFTDAKQANNSIIFANDSFVSLIGYERDEILGQGFNFVLANPADAEPLAAIKAEFEEGFCRGPEMCCRRKDGSTFWAGVFISPVRDDSGDIVQHFASFVDLTRHKEEQARSGTLIDELNDRVRNMLAAVQSIVSQAFRRGADLAATRDFIASRISALSRSHALLAHGDWGRAGLRDIVDEALKPLTIGDGRSGRYVVTGDDIRLPPRRALALGIALHELVLNAVIHGAFSNDAGSILVSWTIKPKPDGDRLILVWREKDGPSVTSSSKKGFGSRVLEDGLAHELEATVRLDYPKDGVICTIDMPAPRDGRDE
jgi:PAS domain S-box-containing protein